MAVVIFAVAYGFIVTERIHKTIVAMCGAALMIVSGVLTQEEAFYSHEFGIDYNVVFLLIGMMVIVNIVRVTGLFEVLAIWSAQRAGADTFRMMALLAVVTAGLFVGRRSCSLVAPGNYRPGGVGPPTRHSASLVVLALGACLGGNGTVIVRAPMW